MAGEDAPGHGTVRCEEWGPLGDGQADRLRRRLLDPVDVGAVDTVDQMERARELARNRRLQLHDTPVETRQRVTITPAHGFSDGAPDRTGQGTELARGRRTPTPLSGLGP